MGRKTHGGKRKGAGAPKKEPTMVIRIPKAIVPDVKKLKVDFYMKQTDSNGK